MTLARALPGGRVGLLGYPLALASLLAVAFALYWPAHGAGFQFDDPPNLEGLRLVVDADSALAYTVSGTAGHLGRPLSLASFLIDAPAWPSDPAGFFRTNVLIHLVNGLLVVWLCLRLAAFVPRLASRREWFALSAGAIFLVHPLLASSSIMIVQRMTTLSASLTLAAVLAYLAARPLAQPRPLACAALLTLAVAGGGVLAALAKENGALVPLFALVAEATIVTAPRPRWFRRWSLVVFGGWLVAFLAYTAASVPHMLVTYASRDFTPLQRLLTESRIVGEYLFLLIVPGREALSPFRDDYAASTGLTDPVMTLVALLSWAVTLAAAVRWRRTFPIASFGILWFAAGHLLESTVFPLELYYHHRNYLPAVGPIFAICAAAHAAPEALRKLSLAALGAYGVLLATVLFSVTSVWGEPQLASALWFNERPGSARAAQTYARQLAESGDLAGAARVLGVAAARNPLDSGLAMQTVQLGCLTDTGERWQQKAQAILPRLRNGGVSVAAVDGLRKMTTMMLDGQCAYATAEWIRRLTGAMLDNPKFRNRPEALNALHANLARIYDRDRQLDPTMRELEAAQAAMPSLDTTLMMGGTLASAGLFDDAIAKLEAALDHQLPANPLAAGVWRRVITQAIAQIRELQLAQARTRSGGPSR